MPRIKRNHGVRSGRGQRNLSMPAPAAAAAPSTAVKRRGLRLKTVSVYTMVVALACVLAFPSLRDQIAGKGRSSPSISRTAQHVKGPGRVPWVANSKT
jgi:hypothetical protein